MGFQILHLVFAAVTLGGLGTVWGAIVGSLVVPRGERTRRRPSGRAPVTRSG